MFSAVKLRKVIEAEAVGVAPDGRLVNPDFDLMDAGSECARRSEAGGEQSPKSSTGCRTTELRCWSDDPRGRCVSVQKKPRLTGCSGSRLRRTHPRRTPQFQPRSRVIDLVPDPFRCPLSGGLYGLVVACVEHRRGSMPCTMRVSHREVILSPPPAQPRHRPSVVLAPQHEFRSYFHPSYRIPHRNRRPLRNPIVDVGPATRPGAQARRTRCAVQPLSALGDGRLPNRLLANTANHQTGIALYHRRQGRRPYMHTL